jgi:hypothetical protein
MWLLAEMTGPCSVINVIENTCEDNSFFLKYKLVPTSQRIWNAAYGDHALEGETLREAKKVVVCSNVFGLIVDEHCNLILAWGL